MWIVGTMEESELRVLVNEVAEGKFEKIFFLNVHLFPDATENSESRKCLFKVS